ncbi:MAG: LTA synthase family protein [Bacteroidaceae bacterium]|nr:LTA synthase family protein [Bacteroidaceae bacterium]
MTAKWAFMLCNHTVSSFSVSDMLAVVWHGLTLDLSTALYFLSLPLLVTMAGVWLKLPAWLMKPYYAMLAVLFSIAFVTDTSMYPFWHFKLDASWLQYLETPTEAMASVTTGYLILRFLLVVILSVLFFFAYAYVAKAKEWQKGTWKEAVLYLVLIPLMVIGIRGGVGESTTNIGQVYYSQYQFLNHSAVNPIFNFFDSLTNPLEEIAQYKFFDDEECEEIANGVFTVESQHCDTLLTTDRPNILVILLESAGEQFASSMPHLQELKKEGVYFSRCYANSWRTDRGTLCALSGYPSFPSISVMKIPEKSRTMPSIALTLKQQGYTSCYLYGGDINFTNFRSYLISTGWEQIISKEDYSHKEQHTSQWGVRDEITFQTVYDMIVSARDGESHLWGYSTLSSHEPWDVPVKRLSDEVDNAFCYLDDCLFDFICRLKQTPQWNNLLIVMMADHGIINGQIDQTTPLQKNHIPMLWVGGAVRQPRIIHTICNQSDMPATLLGQLHLCHDDYPFSRDILSETYTTPVAVHNYSNAQWICDSTGHVLYDFDLQRLTISESSDTLRLQRLDKAIIQLTTTDFQNRR